MKPDDAALWIRCRCGDGTCNECNDFGMVPNPDACGGYGVELVPVAALLADLGARLENTGGGVYAVVIPSNDDRPEVTIGIGGGTWGASFEDGMAHPGPDGDSPSADVEWWARTILSGK